MTRVYPDQISVAEVRKYLERQLFESQVTWMDYMKSDQIDLADQQAAVMDKLYEFSNLFWGAEIPAPGQGYEPPSEAWDKIVKRRKLDEIDTQMTELLRQRQAVLDETLAESTVTATSTLSVTPEVSPVSGSKAEGVFDD